MAETTPVFVMLIRVSDAVRAHSALRDWIDEIEQAYMGRFGRFGASLAHVALDAGSAPWHFALVFPGSEEAVAYLTDAIQAKAPGEVETLSMRGIDLDQFRRA